MFRTFIVSFFLTLTISAAHALTSSPETGRFSPSAESSRACNINGGRSELVNGQQVWFDCCEVCCNPACTGCPGPEWSGT